MAYADVEDVAARWRYLSEDEAARAEVLLEAASEMLDALVPSTEGKEALLKTVCCDMVIRTLALGVSDNYGLASTNMTAGPYSQSWNYYNPSGDMYLTKLEKKLLGISSGYIGTIPARIGAQDD